MKRNLFLVILVSIAVIGIAARLYKINGPIADWHSWRQADTAAVARNFEKFGVDPLRPRYDDLSNIQSGKDNPSGWRMVEFPVYQLLAVLIKRAIPSFSVEVSLRFVSILATAGTIFLLGVLGRKLLNPVTGLFIAFFYAFLPYSMFYGRTTLPEPTGVFFSIAGLVIAVYAFDRREWQQGVLLLVSAASCAIALLIKPVMGFLLFPLVFLFLRNFRFSIGWVTKVIIYGVVSLLPLLLWRKWILQFPEGIAVYTWLFNEGNIRFKGAWFYWLFAERLGKLILGYWGTVFIALGLVSKTEKPERWFFRFLLLGSILYMVIIARGNVQHDYYQILLMPSVAVYLGKGLHFLLQLPRSDRLMTWAGGTVCLLFMMFFSWYYIRTFYWVNHQEIVDAGRTADRMLPADAKVIAPYNGDTTFLYQINRQGWPIGFEIDKKIAMGATYYVTVSPTDSDGETKDLASRYTVLVRNDKFAIIDLTKPK